MGRRYLMVGAWTETDDPGTLHLDLRAMCIGAGVEPTDANQEVLSRAAQELFAEQEIEMRGPDA